MVAIRVSFEGSIHRIWRLILDRFRLISMFAQLVEKASFVRWLLGAKRNSHFFCGDAIALLILPSPLRVI